MTLGEELVHLLTIIDGKTEELCDLIVLKGFIAADFYDQFDVDPGADPEMLDRYSVGPDDLEFLQKRLPIEVEFDFRRYAYFIEAARKGG